VLILLLPLTTICVALAGFYVWHRQLIRKRLFEVAEAGLSAERRTSCRRIANCGTDCTLRWNA
jgi:hypothetical protein